jgi:hypothetical protein
MRATVHIGMPKTGTTTLQRTFTANTRLLDESGILYPSMLSSSSMNHRILAYYTREPSHYPRHMRRLKNEAISRDLINEIKLSIGSSLKGRDYAYLVFSAESLFYPIQQLKRKPFREFIYSLDPSPTIVAYLRSPASFYLAVCQQKLRASTRLKSLSPPRYHGVLNSYHETFPDSRICVSLFERNALANNDIVHDFCSKYLSGSSIDPATLKSVSDSNISLSPEAMAASRLYRMAFWSDHDDEHTPGTKKLINTLRKADRQLGIKKASLKPEIKQALEAHSASDLLWLKEAHDIVFSDVSYESLTVNPPMPVDLEPSHKPSRLTDILNIDLSRFVSIIDYLRASRFVAERPELAAWIRDLKLADLRDL